MKKEQKVDKRSKAYRDSLKKLPTIKTAYKNLKKATDDMTNSMISDMGKVLIIDGEGRMEWGMTKAVDELDIQLSKVFSIVGNIESLLYKLTGTGKPEEQSRYMGIDTFPMKKLGHSIEDVKRLQEYLNEQVVKLEQIVG